MSRAGQLPCTARTGGVLYKVVVARTGPCSVVHVESFASFTTVTLLVTHDTGTKLRKATHNTRPVPTLSLKLMELAALKYRAGAPTADG